MENAFDLLVISPEQGFAGEAEIISKLFRQGLEIFHLRKPHWDIDEMQSFLKSIPDEFHSKIVLHSHFELAKMFGLKGVHLNEENKGLTEQFRNYRIISTSSHSIQDIKENAFPYQYIFLSPIFDSISKAGYNSNFDLKLLTGEMENMKKANPQLSKIIALGGVNAGNILSVKQAGFSGAALLGAVWQSQDPVNTFLNIKSIAEG